MSYTATTTIKNGTISIPKNLINGWLGSEVIFLPGKDSILIKKIISPSLAKLEPKLKALGKNITQKDIKNAVTQARKQTYKSRT